MNVKYGAREFAYAKPFADALESSDAFRSWVLKQTEFARFADGARLLTEEMLAKRSPNATSWWRSHYTEKCRCAGCSGRETDLLAVFEAKSGGRFALHLEIKQPTDKFDPTKDQAAAYNIRARCWATKAPNNVVPHTLAATALLCSETKLEEYRPHLHHFGTIVTFEEVGKVLRAAVEPDLLAV
jgi:hypothetical protein